MLKPFVDALKDRDTAWLVIAMASTLAGNFTVLGSIANLIVVKTAADSGVAISFWDYFRVGAPLTIITLAIGRCGYGCDINQKQAFQPFLARHRQLPARRRSRRPRALSQRVPVTQQHWSQTEVGLVTTIGGLLGLAVQTPIGAAIDSTHAKRGAIVLALAVLATGRCTIFAWPSFWPVAIANSLMAIVGDVFGPAVAA